jgi:hypothetical protein
VGLTRVQKECSETDTETDTDSETDTETNGNTEVQTLNTLLK